MIPILDNIDPQKAQGILANIALGMMPDPGIGSAANRSSVDSDLRDKLLQELRVHLRLKRDDYSLRAMAKLYGAMAEEMKRIALQHEDVNKIKARLGHQGILSPSQYQIKFDRTFRDVSENFGVTQYQVESAIRNPDSYQHLLPEHFGFDPDYAISLFIKVQKQTASTERYTLLVLASRKGFVQEVLDAWRVYPSDLNLRDVSLPVDVLRAFVENFGTTFKVGEKEGKFFMNERLPITHDKDGSDAFELFKARQSEDLTAYIGLGKQDKTMMEAVLFFSIDYQKYAESLKRHGVNTKLKDIKARFTKSR
jgi:hypothetical protein